MQGLPSHYQTFIYLSRYSRWDEEKQRREVWPETVERYCSFIFEHCRRNLGTEVPQDWRDRIRASILGLDVMPSMRALWTAGPALEIDQAAAYNCSALCVNRIRVFDETLYLLAVGSGVGFSVESKYVSKLPTVAEEFQDTDTTVVVADSRIGWASAFRELIALLYNGRVPRWDLRKVRAAGSPLKTFGGRASGPGPLDDLFRFTVATFRGAAGRKLRPVECHDLLCKVGETIVAGAQRRSALISLSDQADLEMRKAKSGNWHDVFPWRSRANNSAVYYERPAMGTFMREWDALYESKSGERGIYNLGGTRARIAKYGRRDVEQIQALNPCQPAWATLLTPHGLSNVGRVQVGDDVWTENGWASLVGKRATGRKLVYRYRTTAAVFYGTDDHRVVSDGAKLAAQDADSIDVLAGPAPRGNDFDAEAIVAGLLIGDGTVHRASNDLVLLNVGAKDQDYLDSEVAPLIGRERRGIGPYVYEVTLAFDPKWLPRTYDRRVPDDYFYGSALTLRSFLRGLYSANGSVVRKRVTLKSSSWQLVEQVQIMLSAIGIRSYFTINEPHEIVFTNGAYLCRRSFDVNIGADADKFASCIGFLQRDKRSRLAAAAQKRSGNPKGTFDIVAVEPVGEHEVYDLTVEHDAHTYWTGGCNVSNCGEIPLRDRGLCNLSSVTVRPTDTAESLAVKVETAAVLGTIQSTFTNFRYLSSAWRQNAEEERLLGVSLCGVFDNPLTYADGAQHNGGGLAGLLIGLRERAVATNREWSAWLGVGASTAVTTLKPEGNSGELRLSASGIHPRFGRYYLRRVEQSVYDPLTQLMVDAGFPHEPKVHDPRTLIFSFPLTSPPHAVTRADINPVSHMEVWKAYQEHWAEHQVSCTVQVKEHEWLKTGAWVYENFDSVSGLSFLPYSDHAYKQAPYEELTREEYDVALAKMPQQPKWDALPRYEKRDFTSDVGEPACTGAGCETQ